MNYQKQEMQNYNIYFIKTTKFKTINISLNFKRPITKEDEVYCALLRRILSWSTATYHNRDDLYKAGMNLYGPMVHFGFTKNGFDRTFYLDTTFVNEKYTEKGMNKKSIEYALAHLWDPYITGDSFEQTNFDLSVHQYVEHMRSIKNNPDLYAEERAWEEMNIYPFGELNTKECAEYALTLTAKDLYKYYLSLFEEDSLDIFVTGDIVPQEITNIFNKIIKGNFKPSIKNREISQTVKKEKQITETADTKQSKLIIGLKYINLTDFEKKYVSLAYNNILGGDWNSKLNKVIREEHSLCYYIYAKRKKPFNISFICSGIDKANIKKTINLIKKQMQLMKENIQEEDLQRVKDIYNNALIQIEDNQTSITNTIISQILADTDSIKDRHKNMNKVTTDDVKKLATKVHIDTIYILEGDENEKESLS